MADKPAEADEAQAYEANDAEADEADVADEATETDSNGRLLNGDGRRGATAMDGVTAR